jgi:putative transposase
MKDPFRYFNSSPEVIRLVVMMCVRYPLSLRNVEDILSERGIDISHETVRFWWNRFGPMFAAEIRKTISRTCAAIVSGAGIWMRCS